MGLVLARIAQSTPNVGEEHYELEIIHGYAKQALAEFLRIEKEKALLDKEVDGFAQLLDGKPELGLAAINGGVGAEAQAAAEEAQGKFSSQIAEGGNPGEFGYKVVDGEISPAGPIIQISQKYPPCTEEQLEALRQEEAEQARLDTFKEDQE
jgi:hypothetical protein